MTEPRAQRTLVKSPPELWAEVSDPGALTRHLGEFGEIRIVRTQPETTVAWEGDRVRGTVELEASGWGTKVTLTAQVASDQPAVPVAEEVAAPVAEPARAAAPLPPVRRRPGLLVRFRRRPRGTATARPPVPPCAAPPEPEPLPPASAANPDPDAVEAVLVSVLDELGSAQKRPFSR